MKENTYGIHCCNDEDKLDVLPEFSWRKQSQKRKACHGSSARTMQRILSVQFCKWWNMIVGGSLVDTTYWTRYTALLEGLTIHCTCEEVVDENLGYQDWGKKHILGFYDLREIQETNHHLVETKDLTDGY